MKAVKIVDFDSSKLGFPDGVSVTDGDWCIVSDAFPGDAGVAMNHSGGVRVRPEWGAKHEEEAIAWGATREEAWAEAANV